jgi:3-hydroxyacyl-[acyl-carrier-protein] dehydratase
MSLKNNFYTVKQSDPKENGLNAVIELNKDHAIYKGHFPQMPVVPGVCQVQIIKELLEGAFDKTMTMLTGDNIKFTGMIIPTQNPVVNTEMTWNKNDEGNIKAEAKLFFEATTFTKFKGTFKIN